MIKLRINSIAGSDENLDFIKDELIIDTVTRAVIGFGFVVDDNLLEGFVVIFNGYPLERDLWYHVSVSESDEILIAPVIKRGDSANIFKQVAIIAIAVAATVYISPMAGGYFWGGMAAAGVTIAGAIAMNALIPTPTQGLGGLGDMNLGSYSSSQMHTITSQSNALKKFSSVPKVYGTHRMFPTIAANPYVEIEADVDPITKVGTGKLVQFFYCIYDFGFGPLDLTSIKIGDTLIGNFSNVDYRLVDLNKPSVDEGPWDKKLNNSFVYYKGDVETSPTSLNMNVNSNDSGAILADYQIIRNASNQVNGCFQEIALDFVCPQGLICYGTNGATTTVKIELEIQFAKVGTEDWRGFNDTLYVSAFTSTGGNPEYSDISPILAPLNYYPQYGQDAWFNPAGSTIILQDGLKLGYPIEYEGVIIARINSISYHSAGFSIYGVDTPMPQLTLLAWDSNDDEYFPGPLMIKVATSGKASIQGNSTEAVYATFKFKPKEIAEYKIRVTRMSTSKPYTYQVRDFLSLSTITTRFDRSPILTDKRHVFLELKIKATNQLNGSVQNLSAVCTSILDVYNPNTRLWTKQASNNPAWIFCDLLTSEVNKNSIAKSRLHLPSIVEWANFCDAIPTSPPGHTYTQKRFTSNFVLDFDVTLQNILASVSNSCQASLNMVDGKYGVLLDVQKTVPVQIFTPRNSWGFSSSRSYVEPPHAMRVRFIDAQNNWQAGEQLVYVGDYNATTSTKFQDLDSFGCTNSDQAWRFGRYSLAQATLRQETISISVDFENLVCTRGDLVYITEDVMKVGGRPARVKSIVGSTIEIDDGIDTVGGLNYGYVFRGVNGIYTSTLTVNNSSSFTLNGTLPSVGDLIVIGEVGNIVYKCLVKAINPSSDLSAQLSLIEYAPEVYTVESTGTIPTYLPSINKTQDSNNTAPNAVQHLVVLENDWRCNGLAHEHYIKLDWDVPIGSAYELFEIYVKSRDGYELVDFTRNSDYEYIAKEVNLGVLHSFKVLAVSSTGKKKDLGSVGFVSATPLAKTTPPSDVEALHINITGEVIQLDWPLISDCDVQEYLIRYSPNSTSTWETSVPLLKATRNQTLASAQARTGTYLIKAIDFAGNESGYPAMARTSIPQLFNLNIIEELNDFPTLQGSFDKTIAVGSSIILQDKVSGGAGVQEFWPEGFYYFNNLLDLGDIYTVRLQAWVEAEGYTQDDIMANWNTLSDLTQMLHGKFSEWDVELQYRASNQLIVMDSWVTLSSIPFISSGSEDIWTPWRKLTNTGDFTGRVFQFRLRLVSNKASVSPRVTAAKIKADMPDRSDIYNNLISNVGSTSVTYSTPFKGPGTTPNIQITCDAMVSGDYYNISSKTLSGFNIIFYDKNNTAVSRHFDVMAKGYGARSANTI